MLIDKDGAYHAKPVLQYSVNNRLLHMQHIFAFGNRLKKEIENFVQLFMLKKEGAKNRKRSKVTTTNLKLLKV